MPARKKDVKWTSLGPYLYTDELRQMMHVFGDVPRPKIEAAQALEIVCRNLLKKIVIQMAEISGIIAKNEENPSDLRSKRSKDESKEEVEDENMEKPSKKSEKIEWKSF
eukprot:TRINITY_DN5933_c0_g1_i1.p1 TRINITY_DN5933_c0_g1~~TRINITY_DN5933_c0_g1_i1.p1  ORF type:complete len:109 (-),score=27.78 TRINITY_DN5933_c0_g1_i1:191-517(-)